MSKVKGRQSLEDSAFPGTRLETKTIELLKQKFYNATILEIVDIHEELRIFRVNCDDDLPPFQAGQYATLGLGNWETRCPGVQAETLDDTRRRRLSKRAYSISCTLLDSAGNATTVSDCPYLEFYIALVRRTNNHPPALTPRLFALQQGDRLRVDPHIHGVYSLAGVKPENNVVFFATGTGEAPHNAMLMELLPAGHTGRIINAVCVRYRKDLAYLGKHRELENRYPNYSYLPLTTREPENLDPTAEGYLGKRYLQEYVKSGELERDADFKLDPQQTHVFLCGSPDMIGIASHYQESHPSGMIDELQQRGFQADQRDKLGNIHYERYW